MLRKSTTTTAWGN